MADDPLYAYLFLPSIRNGIYRASSVYTVALSFGEFAAMAGRSRPICHARARLGRSAVRDDRIAVLPDIALLRGRNVAATSVSWPPCRSSPCCGPSVSSPCIERVCPASCAVTLSAGIRRTDQRGAVWKRLHNLVLGGGETHASDSARYDQWVLAQPHLMGNPITGTGLAWRRTSSAIFQWAPRSQRRQLFTDVAGRSRIPGTVAFFGMLAYAIWKGARIYLSDLDERASVAARSPAPGGIPRSTGWCYPSARTIHSASF